MFVVISLCCLLPSLPCHASCCCLLSSHHAAPYCAAPCHATPCCCRLAVLLFLLFIFISPCRSLLCHPSLCHPVPSFFAVLPCTPCCHRAAHPHHMLIVTLICCAAPSRVPPMPMPTPTPMLPCNRCDAVGRSQFSTPRPTTDRQLGVSRIPSRAGTARRTEQVRSKQ
jgi:hypothetical protein